MIEKTLRIAKKIIPKRIFAFFQPAYHYLLALCAAAIYGRPSRGIFIVGVTGTKGKTTTVELINAMLEAAGYKTAVFGTLRMKIGDASKPNLHKMTMPGRLFAQRFIKRAKDAGCDYVIMEMTSEGAKQFRHKFINLDTLIFTNLSPEHIEAHGSYEHYRDAKLSIARELARSSKKRRTLIVNGDDPESRHFLAIRNIPRKISYHMRDIRPFEKTKTGIAFTLHGQHAVTRLEGEFNLYNILAAATFAKSQNIPEEIILKIVKETETIPGRMEHIREGQNFDVVVDYAHTPDSLEKAYRAFGGRSKICVLGSAGGGRDIWKRSAMGEIADTYCDRIILTDEDPYDEDPKKIVSDVAAGITKHKPEIIMDRRKAIARALSAAVDGAVVIITGKGTDPYIMRADGKKEPWSDARVTREELRRIRRKTETTRL